MTIIYPETNEAKTEAKKILSGQITLKMYLAWKNLTTKQFSEMTCINYTLLSSIMNNRRIASERVSKAIAAFTDGMVVLPYTERANKSKKFKKQEEKKYVIQVQE